MLKERLQVVTGSFLLLLLIASCEAAPLQVEEEISGCYYNYNHYLEGDQIYTNEPCLNCTCHNKMLMCYLRVCPFTKPIGQDCVIEEREGQCCPVIKCPEVPVELLEHQTSGTDLGPLESNGCLINNRFYAEGAQIPSNPLRPCELCYCIRNATSCLMQECTLHVDGCQPIYNLGSCCPVRYNCHHSIDEEHMLDDNITTVRPSPGLMITTTAVPDLSVECAHGSKIYYDGEIVPSEKPCEHCYCMKGDIVCAVQQCKSQLAHPYGECTSTSSPTDDQCCPDSYSCEGVYETTQNTGSEYTTLPAIATNSYSDKDTDQEKTDKPIHEQISDEDLKLQEHIHEDAGETELTPNSSIKLEAANENEVSPPVTTTEDPTEQKDTATSQDDTSEPNPILPDLTAGGVEEDTAVPTESISSEASSEESTTLSGSSDFKFDSTTPDFIVSYIPGEGDCLSNKKTYPNNSAIPSVRSCQADCFCVNSIIQCGVDTCEEDSEALETSTIIPTSSTIEPAIFEEHVDETTEKKIEMPLDVSTEPSVHVEDKYETTLSPTSEPAGLISDDFTSVPHTVEGVPDQSYSTPKITEESTESEILTSETTETGDHDKKLVEAQGVLSSDDENVTLQPAIAVTFEQTSINPTISDRTKSPDQEEDDTETPDALTPHVAAASEESTVDHTEDEFEGSGEDHSVQTSSTETSAINPTTQGDIAFAETTKSNEAITEKPTQPIEAGISPIILEEEIEEDISTQTSVAETETIPNLPSSQNTSIFPDITTITPGQEALQEIEPTVENNKVPSEARPEGAEKLEVYSLSTGAASSQLPESLPSSTTPSESTISVTEKSETVTDVPALEDSSIKTELGGMQFLEKVPEVLNHAEEVTQRDTEEKTTDPSVSQDVSQAADSISEESQEELTTLSEAASDATTIFRQETTLQTLLGTEQDFSERFGEDNEMKIPKLEGITEKTESEDLDIAPPAVDEQTLSPEVATVVPELSSKVPELRDDINETTTPNIAGSEGTSEASSGATRKPVDPPKFVYASTEYQTEKTDIGSEIQETTTETYETITSKTESDIHPPSDESEIVETTYPTPQENEDIELTTLFGIGPEYTASSTKYEQLIPVDKKEEESATTTETNSISDERTVPVQEITEQPDAEENNKNQYKKPLEEVTTEIGVDISHTETIDDIKATSSESPFDYATSTISSDKPFVSTQSSEVSGETSSTPGAEEITSKVSSGTTELNQLTSEESVDDIHLETSTKVQPEGAESAELPTVRAPAEYLPTELTVDEISTEIPSEAHAEEMTTQKSSEPSAAADTTEIGLSPEISTINPVTEKTADISTEMAAILIENLDASTDAANRVPQYDISSTEGTSIQHLDELSTISPFAGESSGKPEAHESSSEEPSFDQRTESIDVKFGDSEQAAETTELNFDQVTTLRPVTPQDTKLLSEPAEVTTTEQSPAGLSEPVDGLPANCTDLKLCNLATPLPELSQDHEKQETSEPVETQTQSHLELTPANCTGSECTSDKFLVETSTSEEQPKEKDDVELNESSTPPGASILSEQELQTSLKPDNKESIALTEIEQQTEKTDNLSVDNINEQTSVPEHDVLATDNLESASPQDNIETDTTTKQTTLAATSEHSPSQPQPGYGSVPSQFPMYSEDEYSDEEDPTSFGPGTCRYGGKLFVSAQQIPRDDPCDFCFCFRSDIICLQQSCPPPINGCHEEPIQGFCCPRYECPVGGSDPLNLTSTSTTTTLRSIVMGQRQQEPATGCHIQGKTYGVGEMINSTSGPCMHCSCGGNGQMKCEPKTCTPEPILREMIAVVASRRR